MHPYVATRCGRGADVCRVRSVAFHDIIEVKAETNRWVEDVRKIGVPAD